MKLSCFRTALKLCKPHQGVEPRGVNGERSALFHMVFNTSVENSQKNKIRTTGSAHGLHMGRSLTFFAHGFFDPLETGMLE
jgi:hypothetical protein